MPYVTQELRDPIDAALQGAADPHGWTAGQVAYAVYVICWRYTRTHSGFLPMATVVGAVVLTMARFVQKVVMPYEDQKEAENGGIE